MAVPSHRCGESIITWLEPGRRKEPLLLQQTRIDMAAFLPSARVRGGHGVGGRGKMPVHPRAAALPRPSSTRCKVWTLEATREAASQA